MKTILKSAVSLLCLLILSDAAFAQQPELQYFRTNDRNGLNVFEAPKDDDTKFTGVKVRVGGDFAIQMQGLSHETGNDTMTLAEMGTNFNLPTANLNLDVQLHDGVRLHMRTYLSARHHTEAWVKGGYMQIDKLDFIKEGFLSGVMEHARFRFGMNDINYGDVHFRRSDNARAIYNPFVGNYIMDAFTTEPFGDITVVHSGIIGVLGFTNGRLNQSVSPGDDGASIYAKLGYDNQINDDLRIRLTGSFYSGSNNSTREYLYGGDRAGGRYYGVMDVAGADGNDFSGRFNPGFASQTAIQFNPFVKFKGIEFFGVYEMASDNGDGGGAFTQMGAEVLYRLLNDHVYIGGRYNSVNGNLIDGGTDISMNRINLGAGWFMTDNVLAKLEYVSNTYDGNGGLGAKYIDAAWNGIVIEAVIGF